jgi:hypothetical protein
MNYGRLELEVYSPKRKCRMLQNSVGDVADLACFAQIGDQNLA